MKYIAFLHKEDGVFVSTVPDLNFTSSYGEDFQSVVDNTIEACELYCEDLKTLPKSSSLEELQEKYKNDIEKDAIPQLLDIKVEKLKRINVMMRTDILDSLPQRLVEFNGNRSAYLQNLVINDLKSHHIEVL